jgi:hypothetical protein
MEWPWRDRPAPLVRLPEEERAFAGVGQLYAWRRYPDGSWWGYVKWTRVFAPEERTGEPERWLEPREQWVERERITFLEEDYRDVPREVWDPEIEAYRRVR